MTTVSVRGIHLGVDVRGSGDTIVLVHGSWSDRHDWDVVTPRLSRTHRTVAVDRRAHGESDVLPGTVLDDVADLAALVEHLGAPVHLVGNSFGGTLSLIVAARHPELVRSVAVHEPPLVNLAARTLPEEFRRSCADMEAIAKKIEQGDPEGAARGFVEGVAYSQGTWERLAPAVRANMVRNARTWLEEMRDPDVFLFEPDKLRSARILITGGDRSPPLFKAITEELARLLPHAARKTFEGAGHVPHLTLPRETAVTLADFARGA